MQGNTQDGYGGVPWMCARLHLVPHQDGRHFTIDYSHPYTNKARATYVMARTTYVMLARASTTFLACAQPPKPLSDAQVDSNAERCARTRRIGQQHDQLNNLRSTRREKWCRPARH